MIAASDPDVVVIDYGVGNVNSVARAVQTLGRNCVKSSEPKVVSVANTVILPGVGHFEYAMGFLRRSGLAEALHETALIRRRPVLGICLGMQLMARSSDEAGKTVDGLGWFAAEVKHLKVANPNRYKVPHVGWTPVHWAKPSPLSRGIEHEDEFYFLHSYHVVSDNPSELLGKSSHETPIVAALEKDNLYGVQFHPEKSHQAGSNLLSNFLDLSHG